MDKIKQLERDIDHIIGYRPSGHPWKAEYVLRRSLIEHMKTNPQLQELLRQLKPLYKKLSYPQGYLRYTRQEYTRKFKKKTPIKFHHWENNTRKIVYLERST